MKDDHEKKKSSDSDSEKGSSGDSSGQTPETDTTKDPQFSLPSFDMRQIVNWSLDTAALVRENIELAYSEMVGETKETRLKTKVQQAESFRPAKKSEDDDEDDPDKEPVDAGPSALVVVKEPKGAWEQMKERLSDSPFIKEILKNSRRAGKAASSTDIGRKAQDVSRSVKDKIEDAREFWETSQNPLVYTVSGVWENITGETEEGIATAEIRKLDPGFVKEDWAAEVKENLAPIILKAHLIGDRKALKPWLGEAVYNKLSHDINTRKHDGITFDPNILDIEENQIIMRFLENGGPVIVVVYMVQQINCIRNRKGEIIEVRSTLRF